MIKKFESFSNEGIKHWFRKNDFILNGFIGKKIRLKIGNDIEEKEIVNDPVYSRSIDDLGFYGIFHILIHFHEKEKIINNDDPYGEEDWRDEDGNMIHSISIFNGKKIMDFDRYNPGNFDWDSVPSHMEIKEMFNEQKIQTDKDGVKLIKEMIDKIADKENYVNGHNKGFHSLSYFVESELKRGDSIFENEQYN